MFCRIRATSMQWSMQICLVLSWKRSNTDKISWVSTVLVENCWAFDRVSSEFLCLKWNEYFNTANFCLAFKADNEWARSYAKSLTMNNMLFSLVQVGAGMEAARKDKRNNICWTPIMLGTLAFLLFTVFCHV